MKIRKGDRVTHRYGNKDPVYTNMVVSTQGWWLADGCIEIRRKNGNEAIIPRSNVTKIIQKREDIKEWWKYL